MPLAKTGTCDSCGYEKMFCICDNAKQRMHQTGARNTSGDIVRQPYLNYQAEDDYSRHQHYDPNSYERKFMEEFYPVEAEELTTYISRTNIASTKIVQSSVYKHLYGGKKVWPCHTTTRYCPVCILAQQVEIRRKIIISLKDTQDMSTLRLHITSETVGVPEITIIKP